MRDPCQTIEMHHTLTYDVNTEAAKAIDALEARLTMEPQGQQLVVHRFSAGLYSRECFIPACTEPGKVMIGTSRIHRVQHQFIVTFGDVMIFTEGTGWFRPDKYPFHGITEAGTRRVMMFLADTMCTTFHPTNETDLEKLDALLYEPHQSPQRHAARHPQS